MDMILLLERTWRVGDATIGKLHLDGEFECFTLEDVIRERGEKADGRTAIWAGEYDVIISVSGRAKKGELWSPSPDFLLPEILSVPDFTAIRMHALNKALETDGCIGVGKQHAGAEIYGSRDALRALMRKMQAHGGPFRLTITDNWAESDT